MICVNDLPAVIMAVKRIVKPIMTRTIPIQKKGDFKFDLDSCQRYFSIAYSTNPTLYANIDSFEIQNDERFVVSG